MNPTRQHNSSSPIAMVRTAILIQPTRVIPMTVDLKSLVRWMPGSSPPRLEPPASFRRLGIAERLHRLAAQVLPQPSGDFGKSRVADDLAVALARPAGDDDVEETPRTCRHRADAVGEHSGLVEGMGDQETRRAGPAPQTEHFIAHEQPRLRIKRAERLVQENEPRLQHKSASDAHALAHAAGELRRIGAGEIGETHEGERVANPPAHFRLGHAAAAQAERRIVPHREPGETGILLENDPDPVRNGAAHRIALKDDSAGGRLLEPRQHFQQGGFAATGGADYGKELAALEIEIDGAERVYRARAGVARIDARHA